MARWHRPDTGATTNRPGPPARRRLRFPGIRTARKYSNPPVQGETSGYVQGHGRACELRKAEDTRRCPVIHTEEVTGSIPVSPTTSEAGYES